MSRRRFYVPRNSIQEETACLPSDQAHHLRDVLRIGSGEIVEIFDGAGKGYVGEVDLTDSAVYVRRLQSIPTEEPRVRLVLAAALIKSSKFEWILQKATELGIHEIIPLKTRFSEIEIPSSKVTLRLDRWDRIIREASKQCRRSSAPRMHAPRAFADFLSADDFSSCSRFLFYEKASDPWRPEQSVLSERAVVCVGPEGGWDSGEIERAREAGWQVCSLGPWVLRAETAAIAAVSIIQHHINLLNINF
jgi:16S rRNA (uracil1498-N3)-methyltransferase